MNLGNWEKHKTVRTGQQLTLGERAADQMRNKMGSWGFIFGFLAAMLFWAVVNSVLHLGGAHGFDKYPYILLNLLLSTVAGLQGGILLIAAKRADQISSEVALQTEGNTEDLKKLIELNNTLTTEIHQLVKGK